MIWECGMEWDCLHWIRLALKKPLDPKEKPGVHATYEDAQKCVRQHEPAALKRLKQK